MTTALAIALLPLLHAAGGSDTACALPEGFILVAHRGVVTDTLTENSLPSLEETIRRGYTHMEVDLRCTKDGHAVCIHDGSLKRTADVRKSVHEVTLEELRALLSEEAVPSFETLCAKAAGRIELMPDAKACPPDLREAFADSMEQSLVKHGLMKGALFIGQTDITYRFRGKGLLSWRVPFETAKNSHQEKPGSIYFSFNEAVHYDRETVKGFQELGVAVIVSINTFHYRKGDRVALGKADIKRALEYGVDGLQIDSVYDGVLFGEQEETAN